MTEQGVAERHYKVWFIQGAGHPPTGWTQAPTMAEAVANVERMWGPHSIVRIEVDE